MCEDNDELAKQQEDQQQHQQEGCDFCSEAAAVVYCRADAARLCLRCDRHVHAANSVSARHSRALLCDVCRATAAAILCGSHRMVFCMNCDFDAHDFSKDRVQHPDRRAVEVFSGSPAVAELAGFLAVGGDGKAVAEGWGADEAWMWETQPVFSLEDLIVPTTSFHGFQAIGNPPLPKNRNVACGKYKEETLRQLHDLMESEGHVNKDHWQLEPTMEEQQLNLQAGNMYSDLNRDPTGITVPISEVNPFLWNSSSCNEVNNPVVFQPQQFSGSSSGINPSALDVAADVPAGTNQQSNGGEDPVMREQMLSLQSRGGYEFLGPDRGSALTRYKEKRKTRRYDKLIRYESRKARADSRVRIKGRFAKGNQEEKS